MLAIDLEWDHDGDGSQIDVIQMGTANVVVIIQVSALKNEIAQHKSDMLPVLPSIQSVMASLLVAKVGVNILGLSHVLYERETLLTPSR